MSRFKEMCDRYDPQVIGKGEEIRAFLESKGLVVESTKDPKKFKVQLPIDNIVLEYTTSKDADNVNKDVTDEVERLASDDEDDLNPNAENAMRRREKVSRKAIDSFEDSTQNIENNLKSSNVS